MFKKLRWTLALLALTLSIVSCNPIETPECGITLRDTKENFSIFTEGSVATDIVEEEDGSVSWVATASGGAGGGVAFYFKSTKEEINIANYESVDLELDYSIVEDKWSAEAMNPGFCMRLLPWDSTGMFGGYEELEYFKTDAPSGSLTYNIKIPSDFSEKVISSSDFDSILAFAIKFNDYQRGNERGDQLKVHLKNVKFNPKEDAAEDKAFNDGLDDSQRGTVIEINYPTRDYTVDESALTDADRYEKHAWVYLPAGYDASDKDTKYPIFILLHGGGQNENTWGLSNKGRGGKIKGYMDRAMANGNAEKFVLVAATGVANKNWGPNGAGVDRDGFNAFGGELRNDLLPYIRANFNVKEGRDYVAMAGLSMGGIQTFDIGVAQSLDIVSNFGGFSGISYTDPYELVAGVNANTEFKDLKIHNLYITFGDKDYPGYETYPTFVEAFKYWDIVENFRNYTYIDGTHDFPVWYHGFNDVIQMFFKGYDTEIEDTNSEDEVDVDSTATPDIETDSESEDEN